VLNCHGLNTMRGMPNLPLPPQGFRTSDA
jgi:hypothetical protein